jgi:hypothetical protein
MTDTTAACVITDEQRFCRTCGTEVRSEGLQVCADHVADELGITFRQLDHWARKGYLQPERPMDGSGIPRRWPAAELEVARRIGILVAAGLQPEMAATFARDGWPRAEIAPGIWIEVTP